MGEEVIQIDSNTYRVEDDYVRFFILVGEEKALVIDTGYSKKDIVSIVKQITNLPVELINTHADGDHISGNSQFKSFYMSKDDYDKCRVEEKIKGSTLIPVYDNDVIDLGNRPLKIITIPGHTIGSIAILDEKFRRIFTGDSVQTEHIFMFGEHRCPDLFENALKKVMDLSDKYDEVIASHGEVSLPSEYVSKVLAAWRMVLSGAVPYTNMEMHGVQIKSYDTKDCGFYL